ncbi:zinc-dependent alcohol dehydrogenase [Novosphingobium aquimarinum]|uniref:zinc-dependent alcohol dehydrogenase n=1 Tax=Novosphingobium aquimarinum TaxID=2682494 RepID=UPI0012EC98A9|nr:zinc-binding dehydrogenase [Novosphingobium aquimarinum]
MRAAVFQDVGIPLSIETVPDPVPDEGEVVIEIVRAGICGSDLHWTETPGILPSGRILGHEFCGTVVDPNGSAIVAGTRVTALPIHPCWHCADCEQGHIYHCSGQQVIGLQRDGALAKFMVADARLIQMLPDGVGFEEGALVEPLAVGHHTIGHARQLKGANVLILGAGPIGLAALLFALHGGAAKVMSSDPSPGRRQMAIDMGAHGAINPKEEDVEARFAALCGTPPDIVVECVGYPGMLGEAIRLVRKCGQILSAGGSYLADSFVPIDALVKEISIDFSLAYEVADFAAVIDAIATNQVKPQPLITDRISLDDLPEKFEALRKPSTTCKLLIEI